MPLQSIHFVGHVYMCVHANRIPAANIRQVTPAVLLNIVVLHFSLREAEGERVKQRH